ncbi:6-bladed beta-propeller [Proteiniphilum sp. X52]|uniref:6-bladed beta-propeller n=1 Tax=Proteiniphilum sp. X52 TaxID=2382159 RepID=UPI000F0A8765|nr:6-bladed beta-propeller [Proteiniphilum sp. X52]RNC63312.1 6-bladed beta-propeller [Proteiniphilum sp. X52]
MHIVRYLLWIAFVPGITFSCVKKETIRQEADFSSVKRIDVPPDITRDEIQDIIELDSYIPLSNETLVGQVEKTIIHDDRICILDNEPKIICFNMKGKVMFKIDDRGAGPTEYQNLKDFAIDRYSERIIAFDDEKRKLSFYDLRTGKYLSSIPTLYMAPTEMGFIDGAFFFKNMDMRFDVQKEHQFYLLHSESGKQIDTMYLPHDAVADFNFDMKSFFYNEDKLLFVRPFDNIVYALQKAGIKAAYEINLPNRLPMKMIEEKIRHIEIPNSGYAYGIGDVYVAGKILYFTFSKDGFVVSTFFDLSTNTFLYNGSRVLANARENLPVYSLMNGVYDGKFFALIPASSIIEKRTAHPEFFHGELSKIKEEDNDVLVFFTVKDLQ